MPMRPYSRLQNTTDESMPIDELLLAEADDLAPLTTTRDIPAVVIDDEVTDASPKIASDVPRGAFDAVERFVSSEVPVFGWRRVLFVVSGIVLPPSRAERELREAARLLVSSVGSGQPDPAKEASS
ncbi:MAG: hypothetical protein KDC46_00050 [Thermoleophilia bacterium]|nr:hypothetical protein [Thermoleophilia bacterium]